MNDLATWYKTNDEYLSAALVWLRLRLTRLIEQQQTGNDIPSSLETAPVSDTQIEQAAAIMQQTAASDLSPALVILSNRLGLGPFEMQILLLCTAMEFDTRMSVLCAQAQNDAAHPYPTFALALALFDDPVWEALSPERPLRYWQLIEINQSAAQPLTVSALRADERVVNYIKGLNYLDDRLKPWVVPMTGAADVLPPSQQRQAENIIRYIQAAAHEWPVVNLLGADSASKRALVKQAAHALGLNVYRLSAEVLPASWRELETFARLYQRESYLLPIALYLEVPDGDKALAAINHFLARSSGLVFIDTRESWPHAERDLLTVDVAKPTSAEQTAIWQQVLGEHAGSAPVSLASQFNLSFPDIHRIAQVASGTVTEAENNDEQSVLNRAWNACLITTRPRLDTLAQRLEVKARTWEDLVLPDAEKNTLQHIMNQVGQRHLVYGQWGFGRRMSRGLGISVLFAGESGTGKTLAAEVIAHQLRLNLYRIDLSQVISKYIGETEKNLRKLFDAAEDGGTILFFDEADALFGKRSEVKDSHDRYANIEINYLLQRMEAYQGLAILATNMKNALDTAFMRRLRFIINFPFPGIPERKRIWETAFPEETAKETLDYARLARFNLTGGSIQNIAINAAFLAASAGCCVTMPLILEAVRSEFRKLEKPINEAEFRLMQAVEVHA